MMLSIIIPITERHDDIETLFHVYREALSDVEMPQEYIFVVDGNFTKAYDALKLLKEKESLCIVKLARTFGEATALTAGVEVCKGDFIMTLPAYLQVDAVELGNLFEEIEAHDLVIAYRWPRIDSSVNQLQTRLFHRVVKSMTGESYRDLGCGVRLMKRRVLDEISLYGDLHRFLPLLAHKQGFRVKEVALSQSKTEKHLRTYSSGVYIRRLLDLMTTFFLVKFTRKPLRFFGLTGSVILFSGLSILAYLVSGRIWGGLALRDRPLLLFSVLLVVLGIQVFAIGLIGEIVIFTHARETREYVVEEVIE